MLTQYVKRRLKRVEGGQLFAVSMSYHEFMLIILPAGLKQRNTRLEIDIFDCSL